MVVILMAALVGCSGSAPAQTNLIGDPGFEGDAAAGRGSWSGTQNAGQAVFERSTDGPHSGRSAGKVVCRAGDVYARWVYSAPDLFASVRRGDRLKLSFGYRASASRGDALVQINHDVAPGWRQYTLRPLKATGDAWVHYEAVFIVDVDPNGSGEVQLRGTTAETGDQEATFDDVSLEVVGHEEPRRDGVVLGDPALGLTGLYSPDGRIVFEGRPTQEWEFMATGTGVTGLTVNFPDEMVVQVNHSAAIDEGGKLRALARLHLDPEGRPFATATTFRMEHDLRRSVIRAFAETPDGPVRVEIRAHVPRDVVRVDVEDGRKTPGALTVRLEEDAPSEVSAGEGGSICLWHVNPDSGGAINEENRAWLAGRTFGLAVAAEGATADLPTRTLALPAGARHSFVLAGVSTLGGVEAFQAAVDEALGRTGGAKRLVATHEAWWRGFWAQASFEPHDRDGSVLRHKAAFDLYRYYLACCAGERRETPVRFQIDLFRYHLRYNDWMTGLICAVEQYQSFYGAMRTGNWEPLRNLAGFYQQNLPYYREVARRTHGHGGARIPMWTKPDVLTPAAAPDQPPTGVPKSAYNGDNPAGALWMLALLCDMVDITGEGTFADETLRPLATDLVEFIRQRYPQRENGRVVIAPCNAGETWQGVRDPAEMVCALRHALPRLISVGRARRWEGALLAAWEELLAATPEVPRGRLQYGGPDVPPVILPGDQLVPAADMSACESYVLPWSQGKPHYQLNAQHTELYAIWPGKLVLRSEADRDSALRSYEDRLFQHLSDGWNLDVVFAACLGLRDEVARWGDEHFARTFVLPCGLARETASTNPEAPGMPESPSMQGMGTGVLPVLEMLLQDHPDEIVILPCWPEDVPVSLALYSPYAGRVEVRYQPGESLRVGLARRLHVSSPLEKRTPLRVVTASDPPGEGRGN
ncbi:MAG: hypothetical protein FJX74_18855 [Armatimonadetes bacterium]|nr:hypothetical protein [Armatimonadota bacterium]